MVIAITAQKGGTGKTTTAATMGAGLTAQGYKVLLIDLDQQGSLSYITGTDQTGKTMLGVLTGEVNNIVEAVQHKTNFDIIPANKTLVGAEPALGRTGGEYRLKEALEPIRGDYDFIIIDSPPALSALTINAMTAADTIVIPSQADVMSIAGITSLYDTYKLVHKYTNTSLYIAGVLLTRHSGRAVLKRDLESVLREQVAGQIKAKVFNTTIREGVAMNEAQYLQQSVFEYAPKSNVAIDYMNFIKEFLSDIKEL